MKVPADSFEAENWPTRKVVKSKAQKKVERKIEQQIEHTVLKKGAAAGGAIVSAVTAGGTASRAATALRSGLVLAAGLASYYATTWLLNQVKRTKAEDLADLNLAEANAYRMARQDLVSKTPGATSWTDIDPRIQSELRRQYLAALARNTEFINHKRTAQEFAQGNIRQYQQQVGR